MSQLSLTLPACRLCGSPAKLADNDKFAKCGSIWDRDDGPDCQSARWWMRAEDWAKVHGPQPKEFEFPELMSEEELAHLLLVSTPLPEGRIRFVGSYIRDIQVFVQVQAARIRELEQQNLDLMDSVEALRG